MMLFANFSKMCKEAILKHRLAITLKEKVNKLKSYCANYEIRRKTLATDSFIFCLRYSTHFDKYLMNQFSVEMIVT